MRRLGRPNRMPTSAATTPPPANASSMGIPGMRSTKLYEAKAPTAMNAAVPSESWPAYPVRMFSPSAASERIRNGMRMPVNTYGVASSGTARKATKTTSAIAIPSWRIGKIAVSAPYDVLNWPASR